MRLAAFTLCLALMVPAVAAAQPLCAQLLDARREAERQGRLDFTAVVESRGAARTAIARIEMGPAYAVGRINFAGHTRIDDATLRRAMTIYERDRMDVQQLRRSLSRLNALGVFE